ncbi:MAG: carboxymuconolactone decarboxylase [Thalassobius sp.]|nr:carboxymuconolactone decarboxylase [Thalassovita sp.]|tara:strand:+ start:38 stop:505 length:468 start_codon:yes stop_codon:yes gene_type:complete
MTLNRISYPETPKGLYEAMLNTEAYINNCGLSHTIIELIKTRASQINGCGYCLDMHHKDALHAGETLERLYLLPAWEEAPCYTAEEKAVLNLTDVLSKISESSPLQVEEAYNRIAKFFNKEEIANTVLAICQINSWNRIALSFGHVPGSYKPQYK